MPIPDTPAGRLREVLVVLKETLGSRSVGQAWADALDMDLEDLPKLTGRVGQVFYLPQEIEEKLKWLKHYHAYLVAWRPALAELFANTTFGARWDSIAHHLTDATIAGVEACSIQLSTFAPEAQLNDGALEELQREISEFYVDVKDADIEIELKRFILKHLSAISNAIAEANIRGIAAVEQEMKSVVAEVVLNTELQKKVEGSDKGREFWNLLAKYLVIFQVFTSPFQMYQLVNSERPALPAPPLAIEASNSSAESDIDKPDDSDKGESSSDDKESEPK